MCSLSAATKPPLKSISNKRRRTTTATRRWIITSLPSGLLVEILSHVASKSVNDLFNAKAICKFLFESGFERHVMQNATVLDKFYRRDCIEQRRADYLASWLSAWTAKTRKRYFASESKTISTIVVMRGFET
ncbi:hypothetical protein LINPERPRIM_LOCUS13944 [Linum perenne]